MPSKEMIGRVLSTGSATVSAEHVAAFARALGDANPLYTDPEAARRGPFGTIVAPPTYPIAFMAQALAGGADVFLELGLDFMTLVHGEPEFEYTRPSEAGEPPTLTRRVARSQPHAHRRRVRAERRLPRRLRARDALDGLSGRVPGAGGRRGRDPPVQVALRKAHLAGRPDHLPGARDARRRRGRRAPRRVRDLDREPDGGAKAGRQRDARA